MARRTSCSRTHQEAVDPIPGRHALSRPQRGGLVAADVSAERHWRKVDDANRLGQLIEGVEFRNGEPVQDAEEKAAA